MHKALQLLDAGQEVLFVICASEDNVDMPVAVSLASIFDAEIRKRDVRKELLEFRQIRFQDLPELVKANWPRKNVMVDEASAGYHTFAREGDENDGDKGDSGAKRHKPTLTKLIPIAFDWLIGLQPAEMNYHLWIAIDPFFGKDLHCDLDKVSATLWKPFRNEANIVTFTTEPAVGPDPDRPYSIDVWYNDEASDDHSKVCTVLYEEDGLGTFVNQVVKKTALLAESKVSAVLWVITKRRRNGCVLQITSVVNFNVI